VQNRKTNPTPQEEINIGVEPLNGEQLNPQHPGMVCVDKLVDLSQRI
jgi:hypothetical protein